MCLKYKIFLLATICALIFSTEKALTEMQQSNATVDYEVAINQIISNCEKKECMCDSRCTHLRQYAKQKLAKARFVKANKNDLIAELIAEGVPPKRYRIERYINTRFASRQINGDSK